MTPEQKTLDLYARYFALANPGRIVGNAMRAAVKLVARGAEPTGAQPNPNNPADQPLFLRALDLANDESMGGADSWETLKTSGFRFNTQFLVALLRHPAAAMDEYDAMASEMEQLFREGRDAEVRERLIAFRGGGQAAEVLPDVLTVNGADYRRVS